MNFSASAFLEKENPELLVDGDSGFLPYSKSTTVDSELTLDLILNGVCALFTEYSIIFSEKKETFCFLIWG